MNEPLTSKDKDALAAFIADYMEICRKHQLLVDSCGCCDSPWVVKPDEDGSFALHKKRLERSIDNTPIDEVLPK